MRNLTSKNWQVKVTNDGTLIIRGRQKEDGVQNLFGTREFEYGICVYGHHMRSVRLLLNRLFPHVTIKSLDAIEELIREEFCNHRSVRALQSFLDKEHIPYRAYSNAA